MLDWMNEHYCVCMSAVNDAKHLQWPNFKRACQLKVHLSQAVDITLSSVCGFLVTTVRMLSCLSQRAGNIYHGEIRQSNGNVAWCKLVI